MRLLILGLSLLALSGCSLGLSPALIDALAKDPATASVTITSIYGTIRVCRTNISAGDVTCNDTGVQVKSK